MRPGSASAVRQSAHSTKDRRAGRFTEAVSGTPADDGCPTDALHPGNGETSTTTKTPTRSSSRQEGGDHRLRFAGTCACAQPEDSGVDVRVGLAAGEQPAAPSAAAGLEVWRWPTSPAWADVIMILAPDTQTQDRGRVDRAEPAAGKRPLMFGHGFTHPLRHR